MLRQSVQVTATERSRAATAVAIAKRFGAAGALTVAIAGCGGGSVHVGTPNVASSAALSAGQNPVAAPEITDVALTTGPPEHRIQETVAAFYRAAWENDAAQACALFSPSGRAGFMRAAKVSFPGSINQFSTCTEAMQIYNASLTQSINELQDSDSTVSGSSLNNVKVGDIKINGGSATAVGPINALPMINPKQISLVRSGDRWLIAGSYSLSKSSLPQILKKAEAKGVFKHRRR